MMSEGEPAVREEPDERVLTTSFDQHERTNADVEMTADPPQQQQQQQPHHRAPHSYDQYEDKKEDEHDLHGGFIAERVNVRAVGNFHLRKWIDVCDFKKKWYEAYVVDVDTEHNRILVHYHGWKSKFDEWLKVEEDKHRIAPLNTQSGTYARFANVGDLQPGMMIDCKDHTGRFYEAQVAEIKNFNGVTILARITYVGFGSQYDIWLPLDSYRIAPHRSVTQEQQPNLDFNRNKHSTYKGNAPTSTNEDMFRDVLKRFLNSEIVVQEGDGNCLFRSVAHQVYGDPAYHKMVRQFCVDYIQEESDFFSNYIVGGDVDFKSYVADMRRDGAWGDHVEIQAMSEIYCRPVEVYAYSHKPLRTYQKEANSKPPIRLSYHFRSHYNSVVGEDFYANLETTSPGLLEKEAISRSQARKIAGVARPSEENSDLARALELSRTDFTGLDFSVDMLAGKSLESLMGDAEVAKQVSALEFHRSLREKAADEEMKLALEMSAIENGFGLLPNPIPMDIDNEFELALQASAQEASRPPQPVEIPANPAELPYVVQQCVEIGFSLDKVMAAYPKFRNDRVPPERVIENMTMYLINNP
eukprot:TRINITY_DN3919_c0_g1_i1.p1 TRINITY_DN3919_c0_g1~~TRINITY_DN3919_c0_g1_i1.p1  ORF type:complete len:584 (-),score=150.86 TRINITY_DN3919_c0_g1_i1:1537-3288(-)